MKSYQLTEATRGYVIRDEPDGRGYASSELYAFSTLTEVQAFLPTLFGKVKTKRPGDGK